MFQSTIVELTKRHNMPRRRLTPHCCRRRADRYDSAAAACLKLRRRRDRRGVGVYMGVVMDSRKFSGHPYIGRIARSSLRRAGKWLRKKP